MMRGIAICFYLIVAWLALSVLLTGCSSLPSMRYCDQVEYTRVGNQVHIEADCRAPVGGGTPVL